ncbi:hypothetical protein QJQ58_14360 [Paenibacillus dendritiformis]|uniref:hypothetical protein n=1 Tax=Paenibacillus dendritiformis TaxID=130049 RepID=UPI00105A5A6A|nr:hypothetical protein [Paenibacillus dendritiformis]TDL55400.1 hypothetical protein E2R60_07505 [Paenibacillus dendritiformis]WGU97360.1 hypothetical protein QJQ58_14360 [Paenibacillus dendritiformis]
MKLGKKTIAGLVAVVACFSMSTAAFANTSEVDAKGYGKLTGTLSGKNYTTKVSYNNDNAYLTVAGTIQDINGNTLVQQQEIRSSRGSTNFSGSWTSLPSKAYAIYGAHGVQGGNTHGAKAVYTYTHV